MRSALLTDDGRAILTETLGDLLSWRATLPADGRRYLHADDAGFWDDVDRRRYAIFIQQDRLQTRLVPANVSTRDHRPFVSQPTGPMVLEPAQPGFVPASGRDERFPESDGFYLRSWAADRRHRFPFLDESRIEHPYQLFYFIWRLSYAFGRAYAHYSLSFDSLVQEPERELHGLLSAVGQRSGDLSALASIVDPIPSRWMHYADESWFKSHEEGCDRILHQFFADEAWPAQSPDGPTARHLTAEEIW